MSEHLHVPSQEARDLLVRALSRLRDELDDAEKEATLEKLRQNVPEQAVYQTNASDSQDFVFFDEVDSQFVRVNDTAWRATRSSGDITVMWKFSVRRETGELKIKKCYEFGNHVIDGEEWSRDIFVEPEHGDNWPEYVTTAGGQDVEDWCRSKFFGSIGQDDRRVSELLADDPELKPHAWRSYKSNSTA